MTGEDICKKALAIINGGRYVYWYGGKGQVCSYSLLNALSSLYPGTYTTAYKAQCRKDIAAGKYCTDCSGFVSMVYGWNGLGTYGIVARTDVHKGTGAPVNGAILWRTGHCGIYYDGKVLEARGQKYGLTASRKYKKSDWSSWWIVDGVDYTGKTLNKTDKKDADALALAIIRGDYGNGKTRTETLKELGYTAAEIKAAQAIVNKKLKK